MRAAEILLHIAIVVTLLHHFLPFISLASFDLAQHYSLVDALAKYGHVSADQQNLASMALYPSLSHRMAAIAGYFLHSSFLGISAVALISLYLSYLFLVGLMRRTAVYGLLPMTILAIALWHSGSIVGWELIGNFFYAQLVGDVFFLGFLFWLARDRATISVLCGTVALGWLTMWVQPLNALHILGSGCVVLAYRCLAPDTSGSSRRTRILFFSTCAVASALVVLLNPAYRFMKGVAQWNGGLTLGYTHITAVIAVCTFIALAALWISRTRDAGPAGIAIACALLSACCLATLQFALWRFASDGSPYAVKKHMFFVVTLGILNVSRLLTYRFAVPAAIYRVSAVCTPVLSIIGVWAVFSTFTFPVAPILRAIDYANSVAHIAGSRVVRGNGSINDTTLPLGVNLMIAISSFEFPWNAQAISWYTGATPMGSGARYRMVDRASVVGECLDESYLNDRYVMIGPNCAIR